LAEWLGVPPYPKGARDGKQADVDGVSGVHARLSDAGVGVIPRETAGYTLSSPCIAISRGGDGRTDVRRVPRRVSSAPKADVALAGRFCGSSNELPSHVIGRGSPGTSRGCGSSIEPKALSEPEGWWPSKQNSQVLV